ncbi:hypothetical protein PPL_12254 [Heterostelium album PN500]|uniref:AB hydrolase-1 domain-containing protein n=1 Tax=Heterostelium pallidum (strain ATCC 26659 / Pp 5 / PN500) TaxID=670386 RepID=D3BM46_HETP5|nr:hypothetical protein PPL_12254 [Heterostelium album PN500]EFA77647.1 hypothetical protein PPL_12254 [Heterostelium album PN500]|eukprot:XP_020429775.1 hypothetical protein PPL_12254 [Heterostelium album PN500]
MNKINHSNIVIEEKKIKLDVPSKLYKHSIYYIEWSNKERSPGKPVRMIYCFHRLMGTGRDFDVLATRLVNDIPEAIVICPDVAGRGKSQRLENSDDYAYHTYVSDAIELIKATRRSNCTVDFIGTSMGGLIGIFALGSPSSSLTFDRLILNDVGPYVPVESITRISTSLLASRDKVFETRSDAVDYFQTIYKGFGSDLTRDQWENLAYECFIEDQAYGTFKFHYDPLILKNFEKMAEKDFDIWSVWDNTIKNIKKSILIIRGKSSDVLPKDIYEKMLKSDERVVGIEFETGHAPSLVRDNEVQAILTFLLNEKL